jgi:hypothetical protein
VIIACYTAAYLVISIWERPAIKKAFYWVSALAVGWFNQRFYSTSFFLFFEIN